MEKGHGSPKDLFQVVETGHRPEGVGVSRGVGRTKRPIWCVALTPPHSGVFLYTPHSLRLGTPSN